MARWQPDALGRLTEAAITLFREQGYENTTVAEIAERAGLTKRTFFRYFADKREVLFYGSEELTGLFTSAVASAPAGATALEAASAALDAVAPVFDERRAFSLVRQEIVAATPELQERELIKMSRLADAVAGALRERGVEASAATLTAEAMLAVFRVTFARWIVATNTEAFAKLAHQSLDELRAVTAA
jgi:AcrR family transcriptional regulator